MAIKIESGRGGNGHNVIIRDYLSARNYLTEQGDYSSSLSFVSSSSATPAARLKALSARCA